MQLLVLDRDGVINVDRADYVKSPEEWTPLPGSLEAVARACHAGYRVVVVTNQSGLARGLFDIDTLNAIHQKMHRAVNAAGGEIEAVFYCPHGPEAGCACRKPRPGLFLEISQRLRRSLEGVPAIGDKLSDVEAARSAGARPMLVRTGLARADAPGAAGLEDVGVYENLAAAVDALLDGR